MAFPSIGATARRWFTIRARTTTSAPVERRDVVGVADAGGEVACRAPRTAAARRRPARPRGRRRAERVVVDLDELGGVHGGGARGGHDRGDHVADEAHLAARERRARAVVVEHHERPVVGQVREVLAGQDRHHARRLAGLRRVHGAQPGVRERGADEDAVQRPVRHDVVDVRGVAAEELGVLDTRDVVTEQRSRHRISLCRCPNLATRGTKPGHSRKAR